MSEEWNTRRKVEKLVQKMDKNKIDFLGLSEVRCESGEILYMSQAFSQVEQTTE